MTEEELNNLIHVAAAITIPESMTHSACAPAKVELKEGDIMGAVKTVVKPESGPTIGEFIEMQARLQLRAAVVLIRIARETAEMVGDE